MKPHPLQNILNIAKPTAHVTPEFALAVAMDLMGAETAIDFARKSPLVLTVWATLLESHGWGNNLRAQDLQVTLLLNAIKLTVADAQRSSLALEQDVYAIIKKVSQGDTALETALIQSLILHKGMALPWSLVASLPQDPKAYGIWGPAE